MEHAGVGRTLALASYNTSAIEIITDTLAHTPMHKRVQIMSVPLFPNTSEYRDFEPLIEDAFCSTQALLMTNDRANLAISVVRESVSEILSDKRHRRVFSVGLITACYKAGALCIYSGEDWIPEDKNELFLEKAQNVLSRLQRDVYTPPTEDVNEVARLIGTSLMSRLHCDSDMQMIPLH